MVWDFGWSKDKRAFFINIVAILMIIGGIITMFQVPLLGFLLGGVSIVAALFGMVGACMHTLVTALLLDAISIVYNLIAGNGIDFSFIWTIAMDILKVIALFMAFLLRGSSLRYSPLEKNQSNQPV